MKSVEILSLSRAVSERRLQEFIRQEEARGVACADTAKLDAALAKIIKQPRSKGRTSRSPSGGGSTEK